MHTSIWSLWIPNFASQNTRICILVSCGMVSQCFVSWKCTCIFGAFLCIFAFKSCKHRGNIVAYLVSCLSLYIRNKLIICNDFPSSAIRLAALDWVWCTLNFLLKNKIKALRKQKNLLIAPTVGTQVFVILCFPLKDSQTYLLGPLQCQ